MREAIRLALRGVEQNEGGPFGAVIVQGDRIVGRGHNAVTSSNDPTAHAEVMAIRDACRRLHVFNLTGCRIYTNCEPCPMCLGAIYWAHLDTVYYATTRADAAAIGFDDDTIYRELALSPTDRRLAMNQLLRDEALVPFQAWQRKPDKVTY